MTSDMTVEESEYFPTALIGLAVCLYIFYLMNRRPKGLPPFPTIPLPIVGNLLSLTKDQRNVFSKWRQQCGDVFSLYFGSKLVVVFNGSDCIHEAFVKNADAFSGRPDIFTFKKALHGKGIIATSGPVWKTLRTFSLSLLRDFGFGKLTIEGKVRNEVDYFLKFIDSKKGAKTDFAKFYNVTTSNVLCSVLFGHRFEFDDKNFLDCCRALSEFAKAMSNYSYINFFPVLTHVPFIETTQYIFERITYYEDNLIKPEIESHYKNFDGSANDFISAYIKAIKERERKGEDTSVLRENFTQVVTDLYIAGTETTATALSWLVLFLLHSPSVQEKCFQEIQEVVGLNRLPKMEDKLALPYINATLTETLRRASQIPLGVLHTAAYDTTFRGFRIPKGSLLLPSLDSALLDHKAWPNPMEFKPERFLDKNGQFSIPKNFIPFSVGRRICLGKALANMELFLFGSALMQKFEFTVPEGEEVPTLEPVFGGAAVPAPYMVQAIPRK